MGKIGFDARLIDESGVGRYIKNLLYEFDKRVLKDDLFIYLKKESYEKVNFNNKRIVKRLADVRWHTLKEQFIFKRILENDNLDLVHFPYFSYPVFYRKKFVITIHDLIIDHYPTGVASSLPAPLYRLKLLGYKKVLSNAVKKSEKIIVPSQATKVELLNVYKANNSKIEVIYEGFDTRIRKGKSKELVSDNFILYVGNAYPHKNLQNLIDAYSNLRKKTQIDLILIGRNDFFYKRINKGIKGVKVLHDVDDSTLFEYYTNARLFIMPSLMEGFGLPLLEAMSLSCPVVSSDTNALKEIGGDACLYFDPKRVEDIEEKIESVLLGKVNTYEMKKRGLVQAEKFSWKSCADKTLKIYESCDSLRQG